jgi:hypothetical protein
MAYQLSPGVNWSEIDLTTIVPTASTTEGAFAGYFEWGPANMIWTLNNELDLVRWFGRPTSNSARSEHITSWFTAANFLSYGDNLQLVRVVDTSTANNATNGMVPVLIENKDEYELNHPVGSANAVGMIAARYPGDIANGLRVSMWADQDSVRFNSWEYADFFNGVTGTSKSVMDKGGSADEMHIIVVDRFGKFSGGQPNTVLERFSYVSKASDAKNEDGSSNYYVDVIRDKSEFIYITNHAQSIGGTTPDPICNWGNNAQSIAFTQGNSSYTMELGNGSVGVVSAGDWSSAFDLFNRIDEIDVSLVMTGNAPQAVKQHVINNVVGDRRDCVAFVSPEYDDAVDNAGQEATDIIQHRETFGSTSYAVMDSGWKKQFDKYNDRFVWVPLNGDIAGLCARTDFDRDPWFSPAGLNRGIIKNVTKLSWNPAKAERDMLYKNAINPVVTFKGEGTVLYGDKTMLAKPSAFDRINVRRLFIVLEKTIAKAAKYSLFEFNDEFTRAQFVALVEPFLREVKGRRGIFDFKVVCDETNNTPEIIDSNQFIGDIYVKPARAINFIQLNFVAVRTGVAFSEIVGKF